MYGMNIRMYNVMCMYARTSSGVLGSKKSASYTPWLEYSEGYISP